MNVSFAPLRADAAAFISRRTDIDFTGSAPFSEPRWLCVTARNDEGAIAGVILAEFTNWFEAHFNSAVDDPHCVTRRLLTATCKALFSRAVRLTALIEPGNDRAVKNAVRLGFRREGYCRRAVNGNRDAFIFGMLKQECPWLASYVLPTLPAFDFADMNLVNAEAERYFRLTATRTTNRLDLIRRKFGHLVVLTTLVVGMAWPFSGIGFAAGPAEVPFVDAAAGLAFVGSVGHADGRFAINLSADPIVNSSNFTSKTDLPVSFAVKRERPQQAFVAFEIKQSRQEFLNFTMFGHGGIIKDM